MIEIKLKLLGLYYMLAHHPETLNLHIAVDLVLHLEVESERRCHQLLPSLSSVALYSPLFFPNLLYKFGY